MPFRAPWPPEGGSSAMAERAGAWRRARLKRARRAPNLPSIHDQASHTMLLNTSAHNADELNTLIKHASSDDTAGSTAAVTITTLCVPGNLDWETICSIARVSMGAYAGIYHYGLRFFSRAPGRSLRPVSWMRLPVLISVLLSPGVNFAYWCDADSVFVHNAPPLASFLPPTGFYMSLHDDWPMTPFMNTGNMGVRACNQSIRLLQAAWNTFPMFPSHWYEQSAINFVMLGSPGSCRRHLLSCSAAFLRWPNASMTPPRGVFKLPNTGTGTNGLLLLSVMGFRPNTGWNSTNVSKSAVLQHSSKILEWCALTKACDLCRRGEILTISQWCPKNLQSIQNIVTSPQ